MNTLWHVAGTAFLTLHGLIHLMGLAAYLKWANIQALPYKTTVLGGQIDLGTQGTTAFGVLWGLAAAGMLVAALAFGSSWTGWRSLLVLATLLSLLLTILDYKAAPMGIAVNVAILVWLIFTLPSSAPIAS
jgi:hypothetical protein